MAYCFSILKVVIQPTWPDRLSCKFPLLMEESVSLPAFTQMSLSRLSVGCYSQKLQDVAFPRKDQLRKLLHEKFNKEHAAYLMSQVRFSTKTFHYIQTGYFGGWLDTLFVLVCNTCSY